MCEQEEGAGADMPAQDRALIALADVLEDLGAETGDAFVRNRSSADAELASCQGRAAAVVRAILALPSVTLHGASAKARAARASVALALLPVDLVDALGFDMARDIVRLRGEVEAGHA